MNRIYLLDKIYLNGFSDLNRGIYLHFISENQFSIMKNPLYTGLATIYYPYERDKIINDKNLVMFFNSISDRPIIYFVSMPDCYLPMDIKSDISVEVKKLFTKM